MTDTPKRNLRNNLLHAIDFAYVTGVLGYGTPEELLAAYDASRLPQPSDQAAPTPCTAYIENAHSYGRQHCVRPAEHTDSDAGPRTDHASPPIADAGCAGQAGRIYWDDTHVGAVPHQPDAPPTNRAALRQRAEAALSAVEAALGDTLLPAAREEALAGIAAVLPPPADRAAEERIEQAEADAEQQARNTLAVANERESYRKAWKDEQQRRVKAEAAVARVRRLHDALDEETALTSPDDEITRGAAARKIAAALDGWTDPAELRRMADETPAAGARQDGATS